MPKPLVYVALAPELAQELALDPLLAPVAELAEIERWPGPGKPTPEATAAAAQRATVLVTGWGTPHLDVLERWSAAASPLRLVAHTAGTVKQLVPRRALERGLLVSHANDSLAEAVAEFTIGAIIMARRVAFAAVDRLRRGEWHGPASGAHEVRGSTVGVIGASAIGRRVLALLPILGAQRLLADPYCSPEAAGALGAELVSLPELLRRSDIVSLHAPVTPATLGMLGAREFAMMKDGALFVNTARGRLVDADALLAELRSGRISALLDVTDPHEPLPPDSPFLALVNCTVLPHIAAVTHEARVRQGRITVEETRRFLRGEPLQHRVSPERWDTVA
jgi:phosphoglycerate dehydrogenase-like enzyme